MKESFEKSDGNGSVPWYAVAFQGSFGTIACVGFAKLCKVSHRVGSLMLYYVLTRKCTVISRTTVQRVTNLELQVDSNKLLYKEFDQEVRRILGEEEPQHKLADLMAVLLLSQLQARLLIFRSIWILDFTIQSGTTRTQASVRDYRDVGSVSHIVLEV